MTQSPKIKWTNITGFGPTAWDQDHETLKMHTPSQHEEHKHHIVHRTHADEHEKKPKQPPGSQSDQPSADQNVP